MFHGHYIFILLYYTNIYPDNVFKRIIYTNKSLNLRTSQTLGGGVQFNLHPLNFYNFNCLECES